MADAKELAARLKSRARLYENRASELLDIGGRNADEKAVTWKESASEIYAAAAALEAQAEEMALLQQKVHELEVRYRGADSLLGEAIEKFDALEQAAAPFVAVATIFADGESWNELDTLLLVPYIDEDVVLDTLSVGNFRALARAAGCGE